MACNSERQIELRRRFPSPPVWLFAGSIALCPNVALPATLDEIEGLSIQAEWDDNVIIHSVSGTPRNAYHHLSVNLYVSDKGNIFWYQAPNTSSRGLYYKEQSGEQHLDTATENARLKDRLLAWTLMGGKLTRVTQLIAGYRIWTIDINPALLTCSFSARDEPEENTGRHISQTARGTDVTVDQYLVTRSSCHITKGNIFASNK
jgi:hypothetical protein